MEPSDIVISSAPHIRSKSSIENIMIAVLIALAPAGLAGIYFFGLRALVLIAVCVASCVFFEACYQKITKQAITVSDCSAIVTGVLIAYNLPVGAPFWMPVVGSFVAIIIAKQLFGGLGQNFINPALAGRAFLVASYTPQMTAEFTEPVRTLAYIAPVDAISTATPLGLLKSGLLTPAGSDYVSALLGNISGTIGETSAILLILGGIFLLVTRVISWHIPVSFIAVVLAFTFVFQPDGFFCGYPVYHAITGGLMLGAFYMATDYSTSPVTPMGKLIFGAGCGLLTGLIRVYGGYPEGVSYSILIMNLTVPLIERVTKPKVYGIRNSEFGIRN